MVRVALVYVSPYGHTALQAEAVATGASAHADVTKWALPVDGTFPDGIWEDLAQADAIIFGGPTYMGGAPWQFKKFADETAELWMSRGWQDKLAGGFTTSASTNGDKGETLTNFMTLANQHGMIWISLGQDSPNALEHGPADINWTGANGGAMAIARSDVGTDVPLPQGDVASAIAYGARIAKLAAVFRAGQTA